MVALVNAQNIRKIALTAGLLAVAAGARDALAKTPGEEYCFRGWCHRVSTIDEMDGMVGRRGFLLASFYDDCSVDRFNTCSLTSSGEVFRADQPDNAASPIFPDGTIILAYNPSTKSAAILRITSAGPYHGERRLDVSRAAAETLGFKTMGVAELIVSVLKSPMPSEARYKKLRTYNRVPGPIGQYTDFDTAEEAAVTRLASLKVIRAAQRGPDLDAWLPAALAEPLAASATQNELADLPAAEVDRHVNAVEMPRGSVVRARDAEQGWWPRFENFMAQAVSAARRHD